MPENDLNRGGGEEEGGVGCSAGSVRCQPTALTAPSWEQELALWWSGSRGSVRERPWDRATLSRARSKGFDYPK